MSGLFPSFQTPSVYSECRSSPLPSPLLSFEWQKGQLPGHLVLLPPHSIPSGVSWIHPPLVSFYIENTRILPVRGDKFIVTIHVAQSLLCVVDVSPVGQFVPPILKLANTLNDCLSINHMLMDRILMPTIINTDWRGIRFYGFTETRMEDKHLYFTCCCLLCLSSIAGLGYKASGCHQKGRQLFDIMRERNLVSVQVLFHAPSPRLFPNDRIECTVLPIGTRQLGQLQCA